MQSPSSSFFVRYDSSTIHKMCIHWNSALRFYSGHSHWSRIWFDTIPTQVSTILCSNRRLLTKASVVLVIWKEVVINRSDLQHLSLFSETVLESDRRLCLQSSNRSSEIMDCSYPSHHRDINDLDWWQRRSSPQECRARYCQSHSRFHSSCGLRCHPRSLIPSALCKNWTLTRFPLSVDIAVDGLSKQNYK